MKYIFQIVIATLFLLFFTFCTWYEGSEILDNPWEWKYSAHFSQMLNDQVVDSNDISDLDYFVYAAKFKPLFPSLMTITALYIIILLGSMLFKRSAKKKALFLSGLGVLLLLLSRLVSNSPTAGGSFFNTFFLTSGILSVLIAALYYYQMPERHKTVV
ncbi:YjdJ family protein [Peribacillus butanolivorans]|uniref:YjdJ family protein n=1 Tax=Peribacillus butanolivorans TaxID=421767 RepID=UPI003670204F